MGTVYVFMWCIGFVTGFIAGELMNPEDEE